MSESRAQKVSETVESSEETVTIPKSQIALLYSQINSLAKSVAEKEKLQNRHSQQHGQISTHSSSSPGPSVSSNSNVKHDQISPRSKHLNRSASSPASGQTISPSDIKALLEALPVYSGSVGECFKWWTQQVESFCKTFNLKIHQIEYFIPQQLLKGRALECYRKVQKDFITSSTSNCSSPSNVTSLSSDLTSSSNSTNALPTNTPATTSSSNSRYKRHLPWKVLKQELAKLDNKLIRSVYIHEQIASLRAPGSKADENTIVALVTKFRKLESQLDAGPLGDRLYLIFQIIPESKDMILEKIGSRNDAATMGKDEKISINDESHSDVFNNVDEVCDFILIHLDELMKSINALQTGDSSSSNATTGVIANNGATVCGYCNKVGHLPSKCFKRKKQRQKEKIKLFDSLQKQKSSTSTNFTVSASTNPESSTSTSHPDSVPPKAFTSDLSDSASNPVSNPTNSNSSSNTNSNHNTTGPAIVSNTINTGTTSDNEQPKA